MCGGFSCSKNALIALNILFVVCLFLISISEFSGFTYVLLLRLFLQLIGFVLITIGIYGRTASILLYLPIVGGIAGCGVILVTISIIGLIGAVKHHQVILFFVSLKITIY